MSIDVKICGLTRPQDVEAAIEAGARYLGFIVETQSKRRVSVSGAARLARPARGLAFITAVTVNADDDLLARIMDEIQPDYIQCHGEETPQRVADISRRFHVKTIRAMAVSTPDDIKRAQTYSGAADFILYDAKPPKGSDIRGGHGVSFDWDMLRRAPRAKYWGLAGGLTPETVPHALSILRPPMLDISTGVEASPGIKSAAKIKAFMKAVTYG